MAASRRVDALLLLVAVVWGSSYLAAKDATAVLPVAVVLFARFGLSTATCAVLLVGGSTRIKPIELRRGAVLGLTLSAVLALETVGVAHTSAAHAGVLISLTVLVTPLLDRANRLPTRFLVAGGITVLGVGLLVSGGGSAAGAATSGDLLILAAAVVRGGHVVLVGRLASSEVRALPLTAVQTAVGTVLTAGFAAGHLDDLADAPIGTWTSLGYLAVGCSVFAFLVQTRAIQRTSASRASLLLGTEPVWALLVGVALGGERPGVLALTGAALVLAGTSWGRSIESAHRRREKERPCATPTSV